MHAYTYTHRIVQSRVAPFVLGVEITARSDQQFTHLVQALPKCVRTNVSEKRTPWVDTHFYTHLLMLCRPVGVTKRAFFDDVEHTWGGSREGFTRSHITNIKTCWAARIMAVLPWLSLCSKIGSWLNVAMSRISMSFAASKRSLRTSDEKSVLSSSVMGSSPSSFIMRRVCPFRGKDSQQAEGKGRGGSSFHERDNTEQRAWRGGEERRERGERRGEERE